MEVGILLLLFMSFAKAERDCTNKTRKPTHGDNPIKVYKVGRRTSDVRHKVTLVGLFPIHNTDCKTLSKIKNYRGFQRMEAMLWALDKINKDSKDQNSDLFIEALIYDTCSDPVQAIKAVNDANKRIKEENIDAMSRNDKYGRNVIIGVVGAAYSYVTIPVAMTTSSMGIPLVSYAATNKQLSKQDMFARTVWSDDYTAIAIGDLVKKLKITSLKTIGTQGDSLSNELDESNKKYLEKEVHIQVCDLIKFPKTELDWKKECKEDEKEIKWNGYYKKADVMLKSKVDAFIIHITDSTKMEFFKSLQCKLKENDDRQHPIQLIATGTTGITDEKELAKICGSKVQLTTIVQKTEKETVKVMNERFKKVINGLEINEHRKEQDPDPNQEWKNPWIEEVFREISNCKVGATCDYVDAFLGDTNEKLYIQKKNTKEEVFALDTKLESVIDAVTLFATTLVNYYDKKKKPNDGFNEFYGKFRGREFFNELIRTEAKRLTGTGSAIRLDKSGDTIPKYDIYQFVENERFDKVGQMVWNSNKKVCLLRTQNHGNLTLNTNFIKPKRYKRKDNKPGTECQPECNNDERKISAAHLVDECCHICYRLEPNEVYHDKKISECKPGKWPNEERFFCNTVKSVQRHDPSTPSAALAITISVISLLIVAAYLTLLFLNREHPVVRKSGTYFMKFVFAGALLCLSFPFIIFCLKFTVFSCILTKILSCLGLTLMFGALLIKTRKIYNIFILTFQDDNFSGGADYTICPTRIGDWISEKMKPKTQEVAKVAMLISVQVFIIFLWILYPVMAGTSQIKTIYPADRALDFCNVSASQVYIIQMYNMLLMIACCGYAYLARNVPSEYNESRYIGHGMFAVSLISMCYIIINESLVNHGIDRDSDPYDPEYMWAVYSVALSFKAVAVIGIMYTNKVIVILQGGAE